MPYQSESNAAIIKRLNVRYFAPAIQREFVWQPEKIIKLFDSLMSGYPIGSFHNLIRERLKSIFSSTASILR